MIAQTYVTLQQPVTLNLRTGRPRISPDAQPVLADAAREFVRFPLTLRIDAAARAITAYLSPIQRGLPLYGPADFDAAVADTMADHAERVLQLLGSDPASVLQALISGAELPALPPRVPREIPNWRAKVILDQMGLTAAVEATIDALPEPDRSVVHRAWQGDAKLARRGPTVLGLAAALNLTGDQLDQLFIAADALQV